MIGRFINADTTDVLTAEHQNFLQYNLYAYCFNNPVNMQDDNGAWPEWATKVAIGTVVIAAAAILTVATAGTGTAVACFAVGVLKGSVAGAAMGAASGAITSTVNHRITTGSWKGAGKAALNGVDVVVADMKKYWKEGECIQFNIELHLELYDSGVIEAIIKYIGFEATDLERDETKNYIEYSLYTTIPEIVERYFLRHIYIKNKNGLI